MNFKATQLTFDGDKLVSADGELTMIGQTKPAKLVINNFRCGQHPVNKREMCGAEGVMNVKRSDFGMKYGIPSVSDDIRVVIEVEAYREAS